MSLNVRQTLTKRQKEQDLLDQNQGRSDRRYEGKVGGMPFRGEGMGTKERRTLFV